MGVTVTLKSNQSELREVCRGLMLLINLRTTLESTSMKGIVLATTYSQHNTCCRMYLHSDLAESLKNRPGFSLLVKTFHLLVKTIFVQASNEC